MSYARATRYGNRCAKGGKKGPLQSLLLSVPSFVPTYQRVQLTWQLLNALAGLPFMQMLMQPGSGFRAGTG